MAAAKGSSISLSRREQNKRDKFNRIVAAARALFRNQGYEGTTTQQIADAASIATGTLFLYAKSKEDLLVLVFSQEMSELIESSFDQIDPTRPVSERVMKLFQSFIDYHARDVDVARALIRELTFLSNPARIDTVLGIADAIHAKLTAIIERAQTSGEISAAVDKQILARVLFSVYYQQLQGWLGRVTTRTAFAASLQHTVVYLLANTPQRDGSHSQ